MAVVLAGADRVEVGGHGGKHLTGGADVGTWVFFFGPCGYLFDGGVFRQCVEVHHVTDLSPTEQRAHLVGGEFSDVENEADIGFDWLEPPVVVSELDDRCVGFTDAEVNHGVPLDVREAVV